MPSVEKMRHTFCGYLVEVAPKHMTNFYLESRLIFNTVDEVDDFLSRFSSELLIVGIYKLFNIERDEL